MSAKGPVFIDTNILIYRSFGAPAQKQKIQKILENHEGDIFISVQVLNEFINASLKKKLFEKEAQLDETLRYFITAFQFGSVAISTVLMATEVRKRYKLSHYDSVIIATALENNCQTLYSEDLQHGLLIEKKLKVVNPFK
jgi:predicted nucleic acid-binding protein